MAKNLKQFGWEYIVVDLGWYLDPKLTVATFKVPNPPQTVDKFGRFMPDVKKFPSSTDNKGFKPLADYIHSLGLKFGIHIMRGIPWQAVANGLPVFNSNYTGKDAGNTKDTCKWFNGTKGVNMNLPAGQDYYNSIAALYAEWGVDFIKADDMSFPYHKEEIAGLSNALKNCGRPIVLSLSPGAAPVEQIEHLKQNANMWRISPDFWDHWMFLKRQFELCRAWQKYVNPGHWPDCDMLPLGKLRITGPDDYVPMHMKLTAKEITNEYSRFTTDEKFTLITLWSIFRSPLMMGGNLPENDELTLKLLTNKEVIELDQNSTKNHEVKSENGLVVWAADASDGSKYVALFNTNDGKPAKIAVTWAELGIEGKKFVRDIWDSKSLGSFDKSFEQTINAHGTGLFKISEKE